MVTGENACSAFLHLIVQTDQFIGGASIAYGTHMPRADWGVMQNFEVQLPPLEEQRAIADVLSDMDTEIEALEARREKTAQIKQGMMQQLLTGRVRLVRPRRPHPAIAGRGQTPGDLVAPIVGDEEWEEAQE